MKYEFKKGIIFRKGEKHFSYAISEGKMPAESVANNLALDPIPVELSCLNSLEQHLIAKMYKLFLNPYLRITALKQVDSIKIFLKNVPLLL